MPRGQNVYMLIKGFMQKKSIIENFKVYFILHSGFNHHVLQKKNILIYLKDSGIDSEKIYIT